MPKVSALISAYHGAQWLERRIENLFAEDVPVEVVVVCQQGSAEDKIARRYAVKIIRTDDIPTIGEAWNIAIQHASGDYLTTANCDDLFYPGGLTRMADILTGHDGIGLVFAPVDVDDSKAIFPWKRIGNPTGEVEKIRDVLERRCIIGPMPLWRASIHDQVGMFREDLIVSCDYDMWLRMARAGLRFYYINEALGVYLKRDDSLEHRNKSVIPEEHKEVCK